MNIFRENPEKTFMLLLVFGTLLMVGGVAVFRPINPEPEPKPQVDLSQDTMIIIPEVEDVVLPGVPDEARTYNMLGLETEGTYWWRCGEEWRQIDPPCIEAETTVEPSSIWSSNNTIIWQHEEDSECMKEYIRNFPGDILFGKDMVAGYKACKEEVPDKYLGPEESQLEVP